MNSDTYPEQYYVKCDWGARPDDPGTIAGRLRQFLDTLGEVHDTLKPWSVGKRRRLPYRFVRDKLAAMIQQDIWHHEDGTVERKGGYTILGATDDQRQHYRLVGHAGGMYDTPICNELSLTTCTFDRTPVDPTVVDYPVMRALTLTMIGCWEPEFCLAGSIELAVIDAGTRYEKLSWITYVPPAHTASVDLVGVPFSERMSNGGLILSATDQPYDYRNSLHLDGSRRVVAATKHLNATLPSY